VQSIQTVPEDSQSMAVSPKPVSPKTAPIPQAAETRQSSIKPTSPKMQKQLPGVPVASEYERVPFTTPIFKFTPGSPNSSYNSEPKDDNYMEKSFTNTGTNDADLEVNIDDEYESRKPKKTVSIDENKNEVIDVQMHQLNTIEVKLNIRGVEQTHEVEADDGLASFRLNDVAFVDVQKRFFEKVRNPLMKIYVYEIEEDVGGNDRQFNYIYGCEMELLDKEYGKQVSFLTSDDEITKILMSRE
jgi:hypothetical protein